ncbi:hypothetical protein [Streptomyces caelestis]|uniref:hypothetical protein n=1 Tax=Streptomyces caelestis TaxID=36816 RepID=UPI0036641E02
MTPKPSASPALPVSPRTPTTRPAPSEHLRTPSATTPGPTPSTGGGARTTTTWYTSPAATAAARRMANAGAVGDPVCSMAAVGRPDPRLVPRNSRIGIGHHGMYWCLIW